MDELRAFSVSYSSPAGEGTVILYATCGEAAEVAFHLTFHPSKEVETVTPLVKRRRVRAVPVALIEHI